MLCWRQGDTRAVVVAGCPERRASPRRPCDPNRPNESYSALKRGCSQGGKAMTNAISCTTVVSAAEFTLAAWQEEARPEHERSRGRPREGNGWADKKVFYQATSNYWAPFAVLSLQINIFTSAWNYPWTSITLRYNEALEAHSLYREAAIERQLFWTRIASWGNKKTFVGI